LITLGYWMRQILDGNRKIAAKLNAQDPEERLLRELQEERVFVSTARRAWRSASKSSAHRTSNRMALTVARSLSAHATGKNRQSCDARHIGCHAVVLNTPSARWRN